MKVPRWNIADAIRTLAIVARPITSADIANDTTACREHWQAIGALKVILEDIAAEKENAQ